MFHMLHHFISNHITWSAYGLVFTGCEIHTFDPFWNKTQAYPVKKSTYHLLGVASNPENRIVKGREYQMMTLPSIIKMLGHEHKVIDILKIDIEGMSIYNDLTISQCFDHLPY